MSESEIKEKVEEQAGVGQSAPTLPAGTMITPEKISDEGTMIQDQAPLDDIQVEAPQLAPIDPNTLNVPDPTPVAAAKYDAVTVDGTPEAVAAKGSLSSEAIIGDIQGEVSKESIAQAATGELDERATTKYQIGELLASFEEGKDPPAWASPAMRKVTAIMQSRGLGGSSMASAAIVQAMVESAIPIAKSDADAYAKIQLVNLNNQQQATLQNAMVYASMDKANLNAQMTAAVNNAKAFLSIDLQNLTNEQRMQELNYQGELKTMLSNQAAENAAAQFNAKSQSQTDQFFAQLDASIQAGNANRLAAQQQFNISQQNAMTQFYSELQNNRDQFNANMQFQIDQSNAVWRRQQNTAETAAINEANRINAQNLFNMTQQAQNNLWQEYRDNTQWALQTSENELERQHQIALSAMAIQGKAGLLKSEQDYATSGAIGAAAFEIFKGTDVFSSITGKVDNLFSSIWKRVPDFKF